jgi:hypothetical protein
VGSSSSSISNEPFAELLARALATLRVEAPWAHRRLGAQLTGRTVVVQVSAETACLRVAGGEPTVAAVDDPKAPVRLRLSRPLLRDLLTGRTTLLATLLDGRLELYGEMAELARFYDALLTFLHGGVRCPSFPAMDAQLRAEETR